jgi:hypothetical protein
MPFLWLDDDDKNGGANVKPFITREQRLYNKEIKEALRDSAEAKPELRDDSLTAAEITLRADIWGYSPRRFCCRCGRPASFNSVSDPDWCYLDKPVFDLICPHCW